MDYPVRLKVEYRPKQLEDSLRSTDQPPSLERVREVAAGGIEKRELPFTRAAPEEQSLRKKLLQGDRRALATIAGETDRTCAKALEEHPGLAWRHKQADRPLKGMWQAGPPP